MSAGLSLLPDLIPLPHNQSSRRTHELPTIISLLTPCSLFSLDTTGRAAFWTVTEVYLGLLCPCLVTFQPIFWRRYVDFPDPTTHPCLPSQSLYKFPLISLANPATASYPPTSRPRTATVSTVSRASPTAITLAATMPAPIPSSNRSAASKATLPRTYARYTLGPPTSKRSSTPSTITINPISKPLLFLPRTSMRRVSTIAMGATLAVIVVQCKLSIRMAWLLIRVLRSRI